MKSTNVLMVVAVLAVALALFNLVITMTKVNDVNTLTGLAVDTADVNLSVTSLLQINFTTNSINWGAGHVTSGAVNADLYTNGTNVGTSTWSAVSSPLVIENTGNENANLSLKANNDAAGFIGSASAIYQINVTEKEAGACAGGMVNSNTWNHINTTDLLYCANLTTDSSVDELNINVHVRIPETGVAIGAKGSVITATAEVV